jgi:hypothetical protein
MESYQSGVTVEPEKISAFVWTFVRTPILEFACEIPVTTKTGCPG